jgi:hypothetical protein
VIWVTWRQHRGELIAVAAILGVIAVFVVVTGVLMRDFEGGLACLQANPPAGCNGTVGDFQRQFGGLEGLVGWFNLIPAVVGIFVGAPLVAREIERGTFRIAWTQSVTRTRWAVVKLAALVLLAIATAAIMGALMTWWRQPWDQIGSRFKPEGFDFEGLMPFVYFLFALSLGVVSGTLLRRTVPAMVVTLVLFMVIRLPIEDAVRAHYAPPLTASVSAAQGSSNPALGGWTIDRGTVDSHGNPVFEGEIVAACGLPGQTGPGIAVNRACVADHGFTDSVVYQPADRFWEFQYIEAGIFGGLSLLCLGCTFWWVRSRLR